MKPPTSSIRGKLVFIQLLTALIVLVVAGVISVIRDVDVYKNDLKSELAAKAQLLGSNNVSALLFNRNQTECSAKPC